MANTRMVFAMIPRLASSGVHLPRIMVEIRINATFLNCRRELRFPTALKFGRDSEIAPTEEM